MFDGTIGHHETMLNVKIAFLHRRALKDLFQTHPVVLMTTVDRRLDGGLGHSFVFKNSICLVGPVDFPTQDVPAETARVAQPLRFHQIGLAAAQRLPQPSSVRLVLRPRASRAAPTAPTSIDRSSEHNPSRPF